MSEKKIRIWYVQGVSKKSIHFENLITWKVLSLWDWKLHVLLDNSLKLNTKTELIVLWADFKNTGRYCTTCIFLAVQPKHLGNQNKMAARSAILHLILMKLCDKIENASFHIYTKSGMIKTMDVDFKDAVQYEPCVPSYRKQADKTKWRLDRPFLQKNIIHFLVIDLKCTWDYIYKILHN